MRANEHYSYYVLCYDKKNKIALKIFNRSDANIHQGQTLTSLVISRNKIEFVLNIKLPDPDGDFFLNVIFVFATSSNSQF